MRRTAFLLLFVLICTQVNAQLFEGEIVYQNSYVSKMPNMSSERFGTLMGTRQDYFIKGNNYKSVFNGSYIKLQLYRGDENKSYALLTKSDSLYWDDYGKNKDVAITYEIKKNADTVMGIICDVITIKSAKSKASYAYNSKIGVDPKLFVQHAEGNWYYLISKTKALPLKTVFDTEQFTLTSVATAIKPDKLKSELFDLPDKNKIAKAFW